MRRCLVVTTLTALLLVSALPAQAQTGERCFPETGFCISGRIREFWEGNGGLPVFGFPKGPQGPMQIEGRTIEAQVFERNRLELHPENQRPYDVLLGRLGADRLAQQGRDPFTFAKSVAQPGCRFFPETEHNVCGEVLSAWRTSGLEFDGQRGTSEGESLALFGLPLSDLQTEEIEGRPFQVQWFERARFELHPENPPPYNVLLGLLGNELATGNVPPAPTPAPAPEAPPAPPIQPAEVLNQYRNKMPKGLWQVNTNGIQMSATGFEYRDELSRFNKAGDGFKYVVFALEMVNTGYKGSFGDDDFYANAASFDLIDLDGQTHQTDTATYGLDNRFQGGTFYPGTKASGVLVFRIAKNSAPAIIMYDNGVQRVELDLRVAPTGGS
jgi:hypothetical protein